MDSGTALGVCSESASADTKLTKESIGADVEGEEWREWKELAGCAEDLEREKVAEMEEMDGKIPCGMDNPGCGW